jgi:hypothetical protein
VPTKRRKLVPRKAGISAAALEAWHVGDWHGVNRELGIRLWEVSPFDAPAHNRPPDDDRTPHAESFAKAAELRRRLIELGGPPGRVGRHGDPLGPARPRKKLTHAGKA